jgi:excisionase family DNA binding protein
LLRVRPVEAVPRLALRVEEAAVAVGVSSDFFVQHILSELRVVRRGRLRLVPVVELERWIQREASRAV